MPQAPSAEPRPGEAPTVDPGVPPPSTPDAEAIERLAEQFRGLERLDESTLRRMAESRALREQAERLLRQMSPQDRQRLEDLARRWGGDPASPGAEPIDQPPAAEWTGPTQPVDARPPAHAARGARESVISEWLVPATPDPDAVAHRQAVAERFREAARGAERAVEQQAIPLRHRDLVRRVFNRFTERAAGDRPTRPPGTP